MLIEAAARLFAQEGAKEGAQGGVQGALNDAVVILAGDAQGRDAYVGALRSRIAQLGLQGRVHLVGHVGDMAAAYLAAHVTVIASIEPEAFGRTAIEAAAVGCPVIATDIGAPPETVVAAAGASAAERATGWLVPPGDAEALAARLGEALAMPAEARSRMAERARQRATAQFSVESMQKSTLGVYDRLLGTTLEAGFQGSPPNAP